MTINFAKIKKKKKRKKEHNNITTRFHRQLPNQTPMTLYYYTIIKYENPRP